MMPSLRAFCWVIFLFMLGVSADPCQLGKGYTLHSYDETMTCIRSLPFSMDVANRTLETAISLVEMNVFKDIDLSPPAPFQNLAIDLTAELTAMKGVKMGSDYDFQEKLGNIFLRLKDPHSVYVKPTCYQAFIFVIPFRMNSSIENGQQVLRLASLVPAWYASHNETLSYLGKRVIGISYDASQPMQDPLETIAAWADKNCYMSKSPQARFNQAIKQDFFMRPLTLSGTPEHPTMGLRLEDIGDVVLPWLGLIVTDLNSTDDLARLCPVVAPGASANGAAVEQELAGHPLPASLTHHTPLMPIWPAFFRATQTEAASDYVDLQLLYRDASMEAYYYKHTGTDTAADPTVPPTAMLRIPSFSVDTSTAFQNGLVAAIEKIAASGAQRLLVDVRGNGGGLVSLGYATAGYLAPGVYPRTGEYDIRHNPIMDQFNSILGNSHADWINPYVTYTDWYTPGHSKQFTDMSGRSFNHTYSRTYTMASDNAILTLYRHRSPSTHSTWPF
ncbi:hypothetical protein PAPYR_5955 [Paratrimastix pyriformis]|uniref:Tail specific protease domain-containing protein n=1 Tax=Paratrimastix pyriformis TaxID=342808 RepID=A0ABQ8UNG7_9EUKA|nr:hypothetical protein PAPYR_5955 [Paratrimastix pyriformis]